MHLNGEKNAFCLSRTPKICTGLQIFQSNLPFSHQSSESHLVGPYSNLSGPNPTGWRCTMCPRGRQFSSDKISLKGSKSQKFRRTAFMPPHLYSGVLLFTMSLLIGDEAVLSSPFDLRTPVNWLRGSIPQIRPH